MSTTLLRAVAIGDRETWLERRRLGVGASEVAAVLGVSPYQTALGVYMSKVSSETDDEDNLAMEVGRDLEPTVKRIYERKTGRVIAREQISVASIPYPHMLATLDGVTACGRVVEYKTTSVNRGVGNEGTDEIPEHWLCQATAQMIVADEDAVDVAVLSLGRGHAFSIHPVRRDEQLARIIVERVSAFWDRVVSRQPPPITTPADLRFVPYLLDEGESIEFGEGAAEAWSLYQSIGDEISELSKQRETAKLRVHQALGTAAVGLLPTGGRVVRKTVHRKEYTCKASTYSTLTFKGDK